jgi:CheY-like chemotaxis protein
LAAELGAAPAEASGAKPLVYAVDDSPVILKIYRRVLHALGCESLLFEQAEEAIARVETDRPVLILTDLNMPEVTGIDLAERVRRRYDRQELPIIMVTTQNEMTDNEAAWHVGVNTILNKPFTQEDIGQVLVEYGIVGSNGEAG